MDRWKNLEHKPNTGPEAPKDAGPEAPEGPDERKRLRPARTEHAQQHIAQTFVDSGQASKHPTYMRSFIPRAAETSARAVR